MEIRFTIEPFRANAFPVIKDFGRGSQSAFDRIQQAGGYIVRVNTTSGNTQDANATPNRQDTMPIKAMDAATCIGCGACVATL